MNAYMVRTKDERVYVEPFMDDGSGPTFNYWPMAPVVAETPAQAKALFLRSFAQRPHSGVETDDYPNLRVRTILKNVDLPVRRPGRRPRPLALRTGSGMSEDSGSLFPFIPMEAL